MTKIGYRKLEEAFKSYTILNDIRSLLNWDASVNLPENSAVSRERQLTFLEGEINKFLQDKELGKLLKTIDERALDEWQKKNFELIRKIKEENSIYPKGLLENITIAALRCETIWREAKEKNDFAMVKDSFEALFSLVKEKAQRRGEWLGKSPYEALMDIYSQGLTIKTTDKLFNTLKEKLPMLIYKFEPNRTLHRKPLNLREKYKFEEVATALAAKLGFNFKTGRINKSAHPFCGGHPEDVRMTHHYNTENLVSALYGVIHETGHGLYAQSLPRKWLAQPVGWGCGYAADEASALLHEFFIGKSKYFAQEADRILSNYIEGYEKEDLLKAATEINLKNPIRIDADVMTYPLHIILRYELEKLLFDGTLKIKDIPDLWKQKHEELLGFKITSNKDGCLQDIHWYDGLFGYFPSYCVGLIYAAQMYYLCGFHDLKNLGELKKKFSNLKKNFYEHGSLYDFEDLVKKSTGSSLDASHYYRFVENECLQNCA